MYPSPLITPPHSLSMCPSPLISPLVLSLSPYLSLSLSNHTQYLSISPNHPTSPLAPSNTFPSLYPYLSVTPSNSLPPHFSISLPHFCWINIDSIMGTCTKLREILDAIVVLLNSQSIYKKKCAHIP